MSPETIFFLIVGLPIFAGTLLFFSVRKKGMLMSKRDRYFVRLAFVVMVMQTVLSLVISLLASSHMLILSGDVVSRHPWLSQPLTALAAIAFYIVLKNNNKE